MIEKQAFLLRTLLICIGQGSMQMLPSESTGSPLGAFLMSVNPAAVAAVQFHVTCTRFGASGDH